MIGVMGHEKEELDAMQRHTLAVSVERSGSHSDTRTFGLPPFFL